MESGAGPQHSWDAGWFLGKKGLLHKHQTQLSQILSCPNPLGLVPISSREGAPRQWVKQWRQGNEGSDTFIAAGVGRVILNKAAWMGLKWEQPPNGRTERTGHLMSLEGTANCTIANSMTHGYKGGWGVERALLRVAWKQMAAENLQYAEH